MFDLSPYNSFGLHVHAKKGIIISSITDLKRVHEDELIILGKGSDVLFTDDYYGTVLINQIKSLSVEQDGDEFIVRAGAGLSLDSLIESLIEKGIYGLENLSAVPGTVGASPIQNVGAYGVEVGDFISEVVVYDLQRHIQEVFTREMCEFGYRTSYFKEHRERKLVITEVVFRLSGEFKPNLTYRGLQGKEFTSAKEIREEVINLRKQKLPEPKKVGNAGCFFQNPFVSSEKSANLKEKYPDMPVFETHEGKLKLAAGWLIDRAGCRGITHGNVGTWEHQALVIVNRGDAKPHELVALAKYIVAEVEDKFGVTLYPEVRIYGKKGEISWDSL